MAREPYSQRKGYLETKKKAPMGAFLVLTVLIILMTAISSSLIASTYEPCATCTLQPWATDINWR